jgi:hypothetical protein
MTELGAAFETTWFKKSLDDEKSKGTVIRDEMHHRQKTVTLDLLTNVASHE